MVNAALTMLRDPRDFGLERGNARVEFDDRERIEILPAEFSQKIAALAGEDVLRVHAAQR